ncbi:hypothetical protein [Caballeronia novacaledonica]|uniref:Sulfotransferase domain protein n=1 Tax=Caballeronia novacaledonica TaxID=1544861 RepID=A0AA37ICF5_9BURK|nr:hypothetical protein [Caballeronia novacaledonica]GJH26028.1 hypothetical protein CBA19CS42_15950 [Caballeronia novacaledonica]
MPIPKLVSEFKQSETWQRLATMNLTFTVTSGRSGTKLLTVLLQESLKIAADHEPHPRANFELRGTIENPERGMKWLVEEKLPYIATNIPQNRYAETSHIYCKGFIELFEALGLNTRYIILRRDPKSVARSLYQMKCVPERTEAGRLVLIGPSDPGVLPLPDWQAYSEYQLCYWYAREIERRQNHYASQFAASGIPFHDLHMEDLLDWSKFERLCAFLNTNGSQRAPDFERFKAVTAQNQNPRNVAHEGNVDVVLPADIDDQEALLDRAINLTSARA